MLDVSNDLQEPATSNRVVNVESGFCFHLLHECLRFAWPYTCGHLLLPDTLYCKAQVRQIASKRMCVSLKQHPCNKHISSQQTMSANKFRLIRINIAWDMQAIISCSTNTLEFDKCSFNSAQSAVLGCFSACLCYNFKEAKCNRARLKCSVSIASNTGPTAISDQLSTAGDVGICGPALRASMR